MSFLTDLFLCSFLHPQHTLIHLCSFVTCSVFEVLRSEARVMEGLRSLHIETPYVHDILKLNVQPSDSDYAVDIRHPAISVRNYILYVHMQSKPPRQNDKSAAAWNRKRKQFELRVFDQFMVPTCPKKYNFPDVEMSWEMKKCSKMERQVVPGRNFSVQQSIFKPPNVFSMTAGSSNDSCGQG